MNQNPENGLPREMLPEELEAAQAANEADALAQLENLQAELAALQAKNAELADQALRAQAEAQNARRRAEEEIAKGRKFAIEGFAASLLPVLDSLEAALAVENASSEQLREGTEATLRQLLSALERNKVLPVAPEPGSAFNPEQQQAISMVPSDLPTNTVAGLLQKGYVIADRVLRPALVTVAAPQ
ncbi:nucleotide exchange factor GrpE [uncultured Ottowia sp.]|uniref:nucleotide exchange factor GrpE n=1 Tax=uncultured Ottowia sp. TaxID=543067 RepID=UPI0025939EF3|nr:nucleotide exchange factor GrpE [uncultured Ottowia sp.]